MEPTGHADLSRADLSRTWALVPIRGLETAKTRLGEDLDAEERVELVTRLLRGTLGATRDARRIAGTIVVTMDPDAAGVAKELRAIGLVERAPGLNEAIVAARSVAAARGATAILVLPADLPSVTAAAVDEVLERASAFGPVPGLVVLVSDRHGLGTNKRDRAGVRRVQPFRTCRTGRCSRGALRGAGRPALARSRYPGGSPRRRGSHRVPPWLTRSPGASKFSHSRACPRSRRATISPR